MSKIQPRYAYNGSTLYHGDCLEVLTSIPRCVDLIVTSPPFNAGHEYERDLWPTLGDYHLWLDQRFGALSDVCNSGAWLIIEIQDMYVSPEHSHALPGQKEQFNMATSAYLIMTLIERGWYFKGEAIWNRGRWMNNMAGRMACAPGSPALLVQHSKVLFFRRPGGRKGVYQHPEQSNEWKALWCRSVWDHVGTQYNPKHPAVMPYIMAHGLIEGWSLPGMTVLDPFAGSGTTLVAAQNLGRTAIGIEVHEPYCELSVYALSQQPMIFT